MLAEEIGIGVAGKTIWLGHIAWLVANVSWTVETDQRGRTVLAAADDDQTRIVGMLRRGKVADLPVPDDFRPSTL